LCITEVVVPHERLCVEYSQGFTDVPAQFASQGRHKVSIRNSADVSFRDAVQMHHVLIFIVRRYHRTLRETRVWDDLPDLPLRTLRFKGFEDRPTRKARKDRKETRARKNGQEEWDGLAFALKVQNRADETATMLR